MAEKVAGKVYASDAPWRKFCKDLGLVTTGAPYPAYALYEIVDKWARIVPNSPAIYYKGGKTTWKEMKDYMDRIATALADLGVKKGDSVTQHMMNSASFAITDWAINRAGASCHWAGTMLPRNEVVRQLNNLNSKVVICRDTDVDYFKSMKEETKLENIIATSMKDFSPEEDPKPREIPGAYQLRDLVEKYPPNPPKDDIDPKKDSAVRIFTAGSTGLPKGVSISSYNVTSAWIQTLGGLIGGAKEVEYLSNIVAGKDLPWVMPILMYHLGGAEYVYYSMLGLPTVIAPDNRDFDGITKLVEEYKPILQPMVPAQWVKVEEQMGEMPFLALPGSAPLAPVVEDRIEAKGGGITDAYGQTEASCICTMNATSLLLRMLPVGVVRKAMPIVPKLLRFLSAISPLIRPIPITSRMIQPILGVTLRVMLPAGKKFGEGQRKMVKKGVGTPILDTDVKLIDPDTGKEVPAGVPGEFCYKGRQVATYLPPVPENAFTEDGYLRSGDVAVMDEDGFMTIVDRTKDMVNVAGFKVYTETLDNVLCEHPAVLKAGSIAIPDPNRPGAEMVKSYIELREGYKPGNELEKEFTDLVAEKCLPYYKPKFYEYMELPLTRVDKVDKLALREREKKKKGG